MTNGDIGDDDMDDIDKLLRAHAAEMEADADLKFTAAVADLMLQLWGLHHDLKIPLPALAVPPEVNAIFEAAMMKNEIVRNMFSWDDGKRYLKGVRIVASAEGKL